MLVAALVPVMWFVHGIEFGRVDAFVRDILQYLNSTKNVEKSLVTIDINDTNESFTRPLTFESLKNVIDKILANNPKNLIIALSPKELYLDEETKNSVKQKLFNYLIAKPNVFFYSSASNDDNDILRDKILSKFPRVFWYYMIVDKMTGAKDFKRRRSIIWYDKEGLPSEFTNVRELGYKIKDPEYFRYAWNYWGSKQAYIKTYAEGTFGSYDADWILKQTNDNLNFENKTVILGSNDEYSFLTTVSIFNLSGKIGVPGFKAYSVGDALANYISMHVTGDYIKLLQNFNDLALTFFVLTILIFLNLNIKTKIYTFASLIPLIIVSLAVMYVTTSFYIDFSRSITLLFFVQYLAIPAIMLNIFKEQESKKLLEISDARIDALLTVSEKVAHDIRSPLSAINLVMTKATFPDSEYKEIFDGAVKRIDETATKILTQYRTKAGRENEQLEKVDLSAIINEIVKEKKVLNTKIDFETVTTSEASSALAIKLDLERIISNILDNSIFALKNIIEPKIFVGLGDSNDMITLSITDNGTGIPEQILTLLGNERITTKADTNQGNGIGLLHAKRVIERFNGKFEISSQENVGTTIKISLPKA